MQAPVLRLRTCAPGGVLAAATVGNRVANVGCGLAKVFTSGDQVSAACGAACYHSDGQRDKGHKGERRNRAGHGYDENGGKRQRRKVSE